MAENRWAPDVNSHKGKI